MFVRVFAVWYWCSVSADLVWRGVDLSVTLTYNAPCSPPANTPPHKHTRLPPLPSLHPGKANLESKLARVDSVRRAVLHHKPTAADGVLCQGALCRLAHVRAQGREEGQLRTASVSGTSEVSES